jgi:hypothetical protein
MEKAVSKQNIARQYFNSIHTGREREREEKRERREKRK